MKTCVYCNETKEDTEFSKEHVIPRALGGIIHPVNPFSTDFVCQRCNNVSGFFIDAPFVKNWFMSNYRADNVRRFLKPSFESSIPLVYSGVLKNIEYKGKICECYLGPAGDTIYHFHDPYSDEMDVPSMVGIPPHLKKKGIDYGFAFLFIHSNNPEWIPTIFNSFIDAFKKSELYFGNGPRPEVTGANFLDIPEELKGLHNELWGIQGKTHNVGFGYDFYTGDRFLAKLALGMGSIFLKEDFRSSKDADLLRAFMWEKDNVKRQNIPVRGRSILAHTDSLKETYEALQFDYCHLIGFMLINGALTLYTNFYGQQGAFIQITSNNDYWDGFIEKESIFYVIAPELHKCVGPLWMVELLAHKYGEHKNSFLTHIEDELTNVPELPPFRI